MIKRSGMLTILAACASACVVFAQGGPPDGHQHSDRRNDSGDRRSGSGRESRRERGNKPGESEIRNDKMIEELIRKYDSDGNGKLSPSEMEALRKDMKQTRRPGDRP